MNNYVRDCYGKHLRCPNCHRDESFTVDFENNTFWKPTGRWFKVGNARVQAHDPYPIKAKCETCGITFTIDYTPEDEMREKVVFT